MMVKTIESERPKSELLDVQRWEDEGGQLIENNAPTADGLEVPPMQIDPVRHQRSVQGNNRFAIELFQPRKGTLLIRKKHSTKNED